MNSADLAERHFVGVDRIMWGADLPHHEGTSPYTREALRLNFAGLPEDEVRQMTSLGAIDVYGFDAAELQTIADRIEPSVMEVAEPLSASDLPAQANPPCPTFLDARILVAD